MIKWDIKNIFFPFKMALLLFVGKYFDKLNNNAKPTQ